MIKLPSRRIRGVIFIRTCAIWGQPHHSIGVTVCNNQLGFYLQHSLSQDLKSWRIFYFTVHVECAVVVNNGVLVILQKYSMSGTKLRGSIFSFPYFLETVAFVRIFYASLSQNAMLNQYIVECNVEVFIIWYFTEYNTHIGHENW